MTLDQEHMRVFSSDEEDELEDQLHYLPAVGMVQVRLNTECV